MFDGFSVQRGKIFGFGLNSEDKNNVLTISSVNGPNKRKSDKAPVTNLAEERSVGYINYLAEERSVGNYINYLAEERSVGYINYLAEERSVGYINYLAEERSVGYINYELKNIRGRKEKLLIKR